MIDWERRVNTALVRYKMQGGIVDGYNILRFAKQGRINIDSTDFAHDFMEWYPSDPAYLILRLAKAGKLSYKKTDEEKLKELEN